MKQSKRAHDLQIVRAKENLMLSHIDTYLLNSDRNRFIISQGSHCTWTGDWCDHLHRWYFSLKIPAVSYIGNDEFRMQTGLNQY